MIACLKQIENQHLSYNLLVHNIDTEIDQAAAHTNVLKISTAPLLSEKHLRLIFTG